MKNQSIYDYLNFVEDKFVECFNDKKYYLEKSVKITSNIDKSVTLIGSTISVLKKYFLSENIFDSGIFLMQKSIRTRNIKQLQQDSFFKWGSFFTNLGALVKYEHLDKIIQDLIDYLNKYLQIPYQDIMIRISSNDEDLFKAVQNLDKQIKIELDSQPAEYYKHKYGLQQQGIYGRNFNIALKDYSDNVYKDIGNVIVIESQSKKYGVEFGIGSASIVMCEKSLGSAIQASRLSKIYNITNSKQLRFADSLLVVANLMFEDVKKIKYPRYTKSIFSKYKKALLYWKNQLGYSNNFVYNLIKNYLELEYNQNCSLTEKFVYDYIGFNDQQKFIYEDIISDNFVKTKIDKIEYLQKEFPKDFGIANHGYTHLQNVLKFSKFLASNLNFTNEEINACEISAVLHDIGMVSGKNNHAKKSSELARVYLDSKNIELKHLIIEAILKHSEPELENNKIGMVLTLADKLDVTYTRVGLGGIDIFGMRQLQYIKDIKLDFKDNKLNICFIKNKNINLNELYDFYFYKKILKTIERFDKFFNVKTNLYFVNEEEYEKNN